MAQVCILASGTRGDVQPAVALGQALGRAGHRVRVLAGSSFRPWIEAAGLEAAPGTVDIEAVMAGPAGREWVRQGHKPLAQTRVMRRLLGQFGRQLIREAWTACQGVDLILSSFTADAYALTIGEKLAVPVVSYPLQPSLIATRDGRTLPNAPLPHRVSRLNYWFGRLLLEPFSWQLYGPETNRLRAELGLAPMGTTDYVARRRQICALHAYSRHAAPAPADWPPDYHITGYFFLPEEASW